ncbi:MAG: PAS domain S-box protein [Thainema sp.]
MLSILRGPIRYYAAAIFAVFVAGGLSVFLDPWLDLTKTPFLLFFGAVMVSAWYGGLRAGSVATLLSAAASYYFFLQADYAWASSLDSIARSGIFVIEGVLFSFLCEALRRSKWRADQALQSLGEQEESLRNATVQVSNLQESERYFRQLAENINSLFWVFDLATGQLLYVNPACRTLLGQTEQDLYHNPSCWLDNIHPQDRERIHQARNQLYQQQIKFDEEYRIYAANGEVRWVWARTFPIYDETGEVVRVAGLAEDITERKQASEALQESERRLRRLVESNLFGVAFAKADGTLSFANGYYLNMLGYSRDDLECGRLNWQQMTPSEYEVLDQRAIAEIQQQGTAVPFEKEYIRKDGSRVPVLIGCTSLEDATDADCNNPETIAFLLDLTNLKHTEENLRQRELELKLIADAVPPQISFVDRDERYQFVNRRYEERFGYPAEEICGKTVRQVLGEDAYQRVSPYIQQVLTTGQPVAFENTMRYANGRSSHLHVTYEPQFDEHQQVTGFVALVNDVTEQRQAAAALARSEERYRSLVAASTSIVWTVNEAGEFVEPQPLWEAYTGQTKEQYQGLGWLDALHPDDRDQLYQTWIRARDQQKIYCSEARIWHEPSRSYHYIVSRGVPLYDDNGDVREWIGTITDVEERQQAVEALRQREQVLEQQLHMLDLANDSIIIWNLEHHITYWNQGAEREYGWSKAEVQGQTIHQLLQTSFPQPLEQLLAILQNQGHWQGELTQICRDGTAIIVSSRWTLQYDSQGQPKAVLEINNNITAQKQVEEEIYRTNERLRVALKHAPITVFSQDQDLRYVWLYNLPTQFGLRDEEVIGVFDTDLFPDSKEAEQLMQVKRQVLETGVGARQEVQVTVHGQMHIYDLTVEPLLNAQAERVGVTCAAINITERQLSAAALQASEERLSLAMEVAQLGFWDWDITKNRMTWSSNHAHLLGLSLNEFEQTLDSLIACIHPEDQAQVRERIMQAVTTESYAAEYRIIWPDNSIRWLVSKGQVFHNDQDEPVRMIGVAWDDTARKQMEQERIKLLELERSARESAEAANRIKDEFLAIVSHELRSPLNPILGWSQMLRSRKLDTETTERALETIERNAKLQSQLVDDLLDVSRILRGKLRLEVQPTQLQPVILEAIETVQLSAQAKGIDIQTKFQADLAPVLGDANRLQQIVWNLLSNAVKFTPEQGRITVQLTQVDHIAKLEVQDTGCGIDAKFLPHVFEYFRQGDSGITREFGGLGLGLAIVRYLSELHGGTVKVASQGKDQGSTFTVQIPLMKPSEINSSEFANTAIIEPKSLTGTRILIVNDDPDMRSLTAEFLTTQGANVQVVSSAAEVIAQLDREVPDVLISDMAMPDTDGYSLIQLIRRRAPEAGGKVPAIAVTAYTAQLDRQQALTAGFQRHLAKPVSPLELTQAILEVL